jgi:PhnB protein
MAKAVKPVPDGYRTVTPYLTVRNANEALEFYGRAFGARTRAAMPMPDGKIVHAEIEIGDSVVMLSEEFPEWDTKSPLSLGGTGSAIFLYVEDVDAAYKRAVDAGCKATMPPQDQFWGDRFGKLEDPYGHAWQMATHIEDVSPEEMGARQQKAFAEMSGGQA